MQTLDDMLSHHFLTPDQHGQITAWIAAARTPQAILDMPAELWRALELASVLIGFGADMALPPPFESSPDSRGTPSLRNTSPPSPPPHRRSPPERR